MSNRRDPDVVMESFDYYNDMIEYKNRIESLGIKKIRVIDPRPRDGSAQRSTSKFYVSYRISEQ